MKSLILIIILLLLLYYINYKKKDNDFWIKQPVMRIENKEWTKLGKLPEFNIIIPENMKIVYEINIYDIIQFLNENFSSYIKLSNRNIKKYLINCKSTNISLYIDDKLIGFIHSRPINILYNGNQEILNYVEYLCVSKKYRGCNIASVLISSLINRMNENEQDINRLYLFKKDGDKHTFIPFIKSKYLCLDLELKKCNNEIKYDTSNVSLNYNEWKSKIDKYKFSRLMNEDEWNDEMKIKKKYKMKINEKVYIIIGQKSKIKNKKDNNVFDIEYIYETDDKTSNTWNIWIEYLKKNSYQYITINDIADYNKIIPDINKWVNGNNFQYYLYNGESPIINKNDIFFTIN